MAADRVRVDPSAVVLALKAHGRGRRQVCSDDRYGFPRGRRGRIKCVGGVATADRVSLHQARGRYAGVHTGAIRGIRADGRVNVATSLGLVTAPVRRVHLVARSHGYAQIAFSSEGRGKASWVSAAAIGHDRWPSASCSAHPAMHKRFAGHAPSLVCSPARWPAFSRIGRHQPQPPGRPCWASPAD